jgi:hypothetical protein
MRPLGVVLADIDTQDVLEWATVEDQQAIETLARLRVPPQGSM